MTYIINLINVRQLFLLFGRFEFSRKTLYIGLFFLIISVGLLFRSYTDPNLSFSFLPSWSFWYSEEEIPETTSEEVIVAKGDTLSTILHKQHLPNNEIQQIIKLAQKEKITSRLRIGQKIVFEYDVSLVENPSSELDQETRSLCKMAMPMDKAVTLEFTRQEQEDGTHPFKADYVEVPLNKLVGKYSATVNSSVVGALQKAGLSTNSIIDLINAYSHQIDFQRQIRSGDKIEVITEKFETANHEFSHHGKILYASLISGGQTYEIYWYDPENKDSSPQYFNKDGQSIRSTLLRTPVNVVRISSHFGYRKKHPVLGYGKMHKGVDFAAPTGTPIYASGNGVVQFVGWKSGYGKFVLIRHRKGLETAYGHASRFANGLKKGQRVKQGQVIAYVGKTGRATGPHLHYEVRINGKQVNPLKFKSTPGVKLKGKDFEKFKQFKEQVETLRNKLDSVVEIAEVDLGDVKVF